VPLAGWWWRVLASLIDQAVIWTIVSILLRDQWQAYMTALVKVTAEYTNPAQLLSALQKDPNLMVTAGLTGPLYTLMIYAIFGQAIYQFVMLVACSASLGQLIAGLRVVEVGKGREHSRLIWWRAAVRALTWGIVEVVNIYLGMLTVLSYLMPLFQRRRQTLHDLAGGTQVIRPVRR
ncbi:MAG: RDD family protein, partial [Acidipropionibacterium jensenii]|nr:RDD family protein [Acidipropionibacterium jensenii]